MILEWGEWVLWTTDGSSCGVDAMMKTAAICWGMEATGKVWDWQGGIQQEQGSIEVVREDTHASSITYNTTYISSIDQIIDRSKFFHIKEPAIHIRASTHVNPPMICSSDSRRNTILLPNRVYQQQIIGKTIQQHRQIHQVSTS